MVQYDRLYKAEQGGHSPVETDTGRILKCDPDRKQWHHIKHNVHTAHVRSVGIHLLVAYLHIDSHGKLNNAGHNRYHQQNNSSSFPWFRMKRRYIAKIDDAEKLIVKVHYFFGKIWKLFRHWWKCRGILLYFLYYIDLRTVFKISGNSPSVCGKNISGYLCSSIYGVLARMKNMSQRTVNNVENTVQYRKLYKKRQTGSHRVYTFLGVELHLLLLKLLLIVCVLFFKFFQLRLKRRHCGGGFLLLYG